jgi:hypothetical protein
MCAPIFIEASFRLKLTELRGMQQSVHAELVSWIVVSAVDQESTSPSGKVSYDVFLLVD